VSPLTITLIELRRRAVLIVAFGLVLSALAAIYTLVLRPDHTTFASTISYQEPDVQAARARIPLSLFSPVSAPQEIRELLSDLSQGSIDEFAIETISDDDPASVTISFSGSDEANRMMATTVDDYLARRAADYAAVLDQAVQARANALERAANEADTLRGRFESEADEGSVAREAIVVRQVELDKLIQQLREEINAIDTFSQGQPDGVERVLVERPDDRYTTSSNIQAIVLVFIVGVMLGALVVAGSAILRIPNDDG